MSRLGEGFTKFVLKIFWPWFLKNIWPVIAKHVIEVISKALLAMFERAMDAIQTSFASRTSSAEQQARQAERQAASAASDAEREKHEAIAKVWREVAEQFRTENEQLRQQLADALAVQRARSEDEVLSMHPTLEGTSEESVLLIAGQRTTIAALPEGDSSQ